MTSRSFLMTGAAWLPEIPAEWSIVPAKALFANRNELSGARDVHLTPSQKFGVVSQDEYMQLSGSSVVLNLTGADRMKHVEPGDFVSHLRSFQGGLERSSLAGKVSPAYTVLAPRGSVFGPYFAYLLKCDRYVQALRVTTDQLRDGQSIRYKEFGQIPLPLPTFEEQQTIADFLDRETARIDALIEAQHYLAKLAEERRGAVIDAALSSLDSGWCHMSYVSTLQTGVTLGGEGAEDQSEYPYLRVANVQSWGVDLNEVKTIKVSEAEARRSTLRRGDVLMTEGGDRAALGRGCIWDGQIDPCLHQNHVFAIRPSAELDPEYLVYVLESRVARVYFESTRRQTTNLSATNSTLVKQFRFPLPSRAEQRSIVAGLDRSTARIEAMTTAANHSIALMQERRSALISAAVTGRIDPRTGKETTPNTILEFA